MREIVRGSARAAPGPCGSGAGRRGVPRQVGEVGAQVGVEVGGQGGERRTVADGAAERAQQQRRDLDGAQPLALHVAHHHPGGAARAGRGVQVAADRRLLVGREVHRRDGDPAQAGRQRPQQCPLGDLGDPAHLGELPFAAAAQPGGEHRSGPDQHGGDHDHREVLRADGAVLHRGRHHAPQGDDGDHEHGQRGEEDGGQGGYGDQETADPDVRAPGEVDGDEHGERRERRREPDAGRGEAARHGEARAPAAGGHVLHATAAAWSFRGGASRGGWSGTFPSDEPLPAGSPSRTASDRLGQPGTARKRSGGAGRLPATVGPMSHGTSRGTGTVPGTSATARATSSPVAAA